MRRPARPGVVLDQLTTMTIYPRGFAFVAVALLILVALDRFGLDWRYGLVAIALDALAFAPLFGAGSVRQRFAR